MDEVAACSWLLLVHAGRILCGFPQTGVIDSVLGFRHLFILIALLVLLVLLEGHGALESLLLLRVILDFLALLAPRLRGPLGLELALVPRDGRS